MRTVPVTVVIASAMMLAVPVGAANWSAMGSVEPDNKYEIGGQFNFDERPGAITNRIYFQAFEMTFVENLNVGVPNTAETHNENPTTITPGAHLGVWRDCNGDGYIGLAESALLEYPAELLQSTAICPPQTGSLTKLQDYIDDGYPSNYNGWVTELIPIGGSGDDPDFDTDPDTNANGRPDNSEDDLRDFRIIRDQDAMIWGDFELPDFEPPLGGGGTCAISPPRGSLQSTGGFINYLNCFVGVSNAWNEILQGTFIDGVPGADPGNSLGLQYSDPDDAEQAGHPLHQPTLGSAESSHSPASVHDCGTVLVRGGDVVNDTGIEDLLDPVLNGDDLGSQVHNTALYSPSPSVNGDPTSWTVPGAYNETQEDNLRVQNDNNNCDPTDDEDPDFYSVIGESDDFTGSSSPKGKRQAEWNLGFFDTNRGDAPYSLVPGKGGGGAGIHPGFGAGRVVPATGATYSGWATVGSTVKAPQTPGTNDEGGLEGGRPWILTFYAYVGTSTTALGFVTPGATGTYGVDQCGSLTTGIGGGWDCDPDAWYFNDDGTPMNEPLDSGGFARPGQIYQLRDIDCYDGATNAGVALGSPALIGPDTCN